MSKKIGSRLAESLRQMRSQPSTEAGQPDAPPPAPPVRAPDTQPAVVSPAPVASHRVLHPSRIWPD